MGGGEASEFTGTVQAIRAEMPFFFLKKEGKKAFFSLQTLISVKKCNRVKMLLGLEVNVKKIQANPIVTLIRNNNYNLH